MSFDDLLARIEKLPPPVMGQNAVPPPELVAFTVRVARGNRQLKKAALASMAGVSLSSVERIERGEAVSGSVLDSVGIALGYENGYFTAPREPIPTDQAMKGFVETYEHLVRVEVAPIRTQQQVRALADVHCYLPFVPEDDEQQRDAVCGLVEWIDFAAFALNDDQFDHQLEPLPRRKLYGDILNHVANIERDGLTILAGIMEAPVPLVPERKMAVVSITSKASDPGAVKRTSLLVDRRWALQKPGPFPWEV